MALTGFMMWNPLATIKVLPGEFIPAAKTAHGAEAVLAVLAIIVWHMYGVHVKRFNKSMWTGKLTEAGDAARASARAGRHQGRRRAAACGPPWYVHGS